MFTIDRIHVRELFNAQIDAKDLSKRIIEMGGKSIIISDTAVLSSIEDYRSVLSENGIKTVPSVEFCISDNDVDIHKLVLIAMNDNGYKKISKLVTLSNKKFVDELPCLSTKDFFSFIDTYGAKDIIVTSAGVDGVISSVLLSNNEFNRKIEDLLKERENYISPADEIVSKTEDNFNKAQEVVEKLTKKRDYLKLLSEKKYKKRENAINKAEAKGEDVSELKKALKLEKEESEKTKSELIPLANELKAARKSLTLAKKDLETVNSGVDKYLDVEEQIAAIKKEFASESDLYINAKNVAKLYMEKLGKNFLIEIGYHGSDDERYVCEKLVDIANELNISLIASNNAYMLTNSEDERLRRQILRSMKDKDNSVFLEEEVGDSERYLKTYEELKSSLLKVISEEDADKAINNLALLDKICNVKFKTGSHYPKFSDNSEEYFDKEIEKGIVWRFPNGFDEEHKQRLEAEVKVIKSMGYVDYHLIVKDFLEYGRLLGYLSEDEIADAPLTIEELKTLIDKKGYKNPGMRIGNGRGSAVGSIVCYLLGITSLDPIEYGLLFERFLNPERVSMPDIDSDISNATRSKVIQYVQNKYGYDAVCGIMTTNAQAPKGAIRIAAKYFGLKKYNEGLLKLGDTIVKLVTKEVGVSFDSTVSESGKLDSESNITLYEYLQNKFAKDTDALEVLRWAKIIEGSFTAYGAHAAGIVISDGKPVSDYLPLRYNENLGMMTTQCDMGQTEDAGLLKFDFLGLKTLDIITETLKMIERNTGLIIDPYSINREDENVLSEIFAKAKTNAVFQFASSGMKQMLKRFKPSNFEDLIILVSMFRPGPLQYLDSVIDVKTGAKKMTFLCNELKPILSKTYGAIVYQEQVMQICQSLAGYTLGGADQVRRYMSKKKADKLAHERTVFVEGCSKKGISEKVSNEIFDQMMDFARYAFNKSHAAAYAFNAYITGWLKFYYPTEFFAAALNWAEFEEIEGLIAEAKDFGVEVLAPSINQSNVKFDAIDGKIIYALSSIKGVASHSEGIVNERNNGPYKSISDFMLRNKVGESLIHKLINAGAFDEFNSNRRASKEYVSAIKKIVENINDKNNFVECANLVLPNIEILDIEQIIKMQKEHGYKAEITSATTVEKLTKRIETAKEAIKNLSIELSGISVSNVSENQKAKMEEEKKLLGAYITMHPMDIYPEAEELGLETINEALLDNSEEIYGIIENLKITQRKKDGQKMAFFNLVDKTNSVKVVVFVNEYVKFGDKLIEGSAFIIGGKLESKLESNNDSEDINFSFIAKDINEVEEKKSTYMLKVNSYAKFHFLSEADFIREFACKNGHKLLIHDEFLGETREATYTVSPSALFFDNVVEVNIY